MGFRMNHDWHFHPKNHHEAGMVVVCNFQKVFQVVEEFRPFYQKTSSLGREF